MQLPSMMRLPRLRWLEEVLVAAAAARRVVHQLLLLLLLLLRRRRPLAPRHLCLSPLQLGQHENFSLP